MHVHNEFLSIEGFMYEAFVVSLLETLTDSYHGQFVTSLWVVGKASGLTGSKAQVRSCVLFQTPHHSLKARVVEHTGYRIAVLIFSKCFSCRVISAFQIVTS